MDVILGADAIRRPLTGLGRYSLELAARLPLDPRVSRLRFFGQMGWIEDPASTLRSPTCSPSVRERLRDRLATNSWAVRIFEGVRPSYAGWRLRAEKNTVFHSPNFVLPVFPGAAVATVHDLSHVRFPAFHPQARVEFLNRALPRTVARADHLITDSEFVRKELIAHFGIPANRVTAIPLGVDPRFNPERKGDLPDALAKLRIRSGMYTLFVGTVEPRKNLDGLLDAYRALPMDLRQRWPLVIAGDRGWRSGQLHRRITAAGAEGWLHYLDFVDDEWLPALYANAHLFVYPSFYEGFGLPPLEAMASGVPVITANSASLPEVVGEAAFMVDPDAAEALVDALRMGLENQAWRAYARTAGLARAKRFSWEAATRRTVDVYAAALDSLMSTGERSGHLGR